MKDFDKFFEENYLSKQGLFSLKGIAGFKAAFDHNAGPMVDRVMWTYLMFQLWWEEYMVNAK